MKSKILLTVFLLLSVPFVALADDSLTENLIPFTAIVTPFVALLLALFFFWLYSYRKEQIRAQVIEKALENGRDLPDGHRVRIFVYGIYVGRICVYRCRYHFLDYGSRWPVGLLAEKVVKGNEQGRFGQ